MTPELEALAGKPAVHHCANCGSWQRRKLDYGHCWSGDRLDNDFTHGPADVTYPSDRCEAWWHGTFDPAVLVARGGDPDAEWQWQSFASDPALRASTPTQNHKGPHDE